MSKKVFLNKFIAQKVGRNEMKQLILPIIASSAILLSTGSALANCDTCVEQPYYLGVDAEWRDMGFKRGLGDNLFKRKYLEGNVYGGMKFTDYFGVEIGYRESAKKRSKSANEADQMELGDTIPAGVNYSSNLVQIKAPYINLVGYLPICKESGTELLGSVGFAHTWVRLRHRPTGIQVGPFSQAQQNGLQDDFKKEKFILQVKAGIQQLITCNFGIRAVVGWENTSKFKNIKSIQNDALRASLKNSTTYGLGAFFNF